MAFLVPQAAGRQVAIMTMGVAKLLLTTILKLSIVTATISR